MRKPLRRALPLARDGSFDEVVVPHLDAALRLARWLMRNEHDAEDVVQEASLRAFRYFRTFTGGDGRAWLLRIVRNTCFTWRRRRVDTLTDVFDEQRHGVVLQSSDPETLMVETDNAERVARAVHKLPDRLHHLFVLREFEGLSYRELADESGIPIGTVMSRLSRAREALRGALEKELKLSATSAMPDITEEGTVNGLRPGSGNGGNCETRVWHRSHHAFIDRWGAG
jgi:RNA polymerase sigma factor (sigma-70 family)